VLLQTNQARSADLANDRTVPMNYYCPLEIINSRLPRDAIVINEGSETMDIGMCERKTVLSFPLCVSFI
jgi:2-hydroxyacyl-CoA lyase 1